MHARNKVKIHESYNVNVKRNSREFLIVKVALVAPLRECWRGNRVWLPAPRSGVGLPGERAAEVSELDGAGEDRDRAGRGA
jgi:hypothetical protein